ncbi:hypothetical protein MHYP_G00216990 [Metynnis hypsauchen]
MQEYEKSKTLTDATRRQMINILAAEMTETHGEWVWILGMAIEDDTKKNCRGKRCLRKQITQTWWARPRKTTLTSDDVPTDEDVEAAIAVLRYSADEDTVRVKMKSTFIYRQAMVNDADKSADVFLVFPRFLDTPGLVGTSVQQHLDSITQSSQPYLLALGSTKSSIHSYFVVIDKHALPCKATGSVGAFDELFKAHFAFGT